jgi:hypothetical protein
MPTTLINALESYPEGVIGLSLHELMTFSALVHHLKERISWHQSATLCGPPLSLPNDVVVFCTNALCSSRETIIQSWKAFRELVWRDEDTDDTASRLRNGKLLGLFLQHGCKHAIGECCSFLETC